MSIFQIQAPSLINNSVHLPASKSISNRALILNALGNSTFPIENLSESDDTQVLLKALNTKGNHFDIGAAGTSMRFLTAYLALKEGDWTITGSERMKNRPIKILVEALSELGANIEYIEKEGYPPLHIRGKELQGGSIRLNGSISSQYVSAIMMIAPCLKKGLEIIMEGDIISIPYIQMTQSLMKSFGVDVKWENQKISIQSQSYQSVPFKVESDWSAASYWYEIAALSKENTKIELIGLHQHSSQGDSLGRNLFQKLGVQTSFSEKGLVLSKKAIKVNEYLSYNFINEPDLAQTFVVTCCLMNIPFRFTGLQTLRIKETDRIAALQQEMRKLGYVLQDENNHTLIWDGQRAEPEKDPVIFTYEDHRMAMAFAPVCIKKDKIKIKDPEVVSKSYPKYWDNLLQAGFTIIDIL